MRGERDPHRNCKEAQMTLREFRKAGHGPTLAAAFLYFDVSFMIWVILGPLAPFLGQALHLSAAQKGFLTAVPPLGGALFRPVLGWMTERFGGRRTGLIGLALTLVPLVIGWQFAASFGHFLALGVLLGVAGASFAAALPLASSWYPPEYQGLAMGIAGAGNSGTLLATLFAPRLARAFGWHTVFGLAMIPVALVYVAFFLMAKDGPGSSRTVKRWRDYKTLLQEPDAGWFCFIYSLTFGGFVGLASYLSIFFHDQYALTPVQAGDLTTVVVLFGSFLRPVGGLLADRWGGYRMLLFLLAGIAACLAVVATLPAVQFAMVFLILTMAMLGMGNGAVFQLVPQRFPKQVGIMTGIVGAAGGLGGFFLPSMLGAIKGRTGTFALGFGIFSVVVLTGSAALLYLGRVWRRTWSAESAMRAGLQMMEQDAEAASADLAG
jgi:NNP family nitrate/nitrite transporter-like MFS transporter